VKPLSLSLDGKIAVVTGAGQGIGKCVAKTIAANGGTTILIDLNEEALKQTAQEIEEIGAETTYILNNVSSVTDVEKATSIIRETYGHIDILVNCAGVICENVSAENINMDDFDRVISVNLKGTLNWCKHAALLMIPQNYGKIVNLASQAALLSLPHQSIYTASKGGVAAVTRSLAIDWAPHNINVNAIAPTFIKTPMAEPMLNDQSVLNASIKRIPLGRIGEPEDIANTVSFLVSDLARLITGQVIAVDGGWTAGEPGLDL
jgi:NAD(P)-dependent dehydrogenase (short-subunit alcohol dehydrogenase family)